ncbi:hypothetical protein JMJ77_0001554 [Colletotrichum scovillei]|uniref:Uncharacterized protein n=1 Tax=Colletotrichum scovillei TaxID=1209932 RepID=A0A9P7R9H4_9PEZI|nr:hypothetical protein JMJ77_0001554 [Colletotrichum scovillei]KAG7069963.1 hypothetical protein JMJ76_0001222 [Colletotrichum scovillei]KAG7078215.1 hypothetical protein JMJ78_0001889 [Colletotrichum scovillei]
MPSSDAHSLRTGDSKSGKSGQRAMRTTRLEAWMTEEPPIPLAAYGLAQTTGRRQGTQSGIEKFDQTWDKAARK